jgi:hypothetical protein
MKSSKDMQLGDALILLSVEDGARCRPIKEVSCLTVVFILL